MLTWQGPLPFTDLDAQVGWSDHTGLREGGDPPWIPVCLANSWSQRAFLRPIGRKDRHQWDLTGWDCLTAFSCVYHIRTLTQEDHRSTQRLELVSGMCL